jgi:hypothetical protein
VFVKYPAVGSVFSKRPERESEEVKNQSLVRMSGAQTEHKEDHGTSGIEYRYGVELASRNACLLAFVCADRTNARTTDKAHKSLLQSLSDRWYLLNGEES